MTRSADQWATPPKVPHDHYVSALVYSDPDIFREEQEKIFKKVWKVTAGEEDAPKATDAQRSWREILLAAALQGAIFALVKAAVDRGAATGTRKLTGVWPGDEGQQAGKAA